MIYLCGIPHAGLPSTTPFISRGLTGYTVGNLSTVGILGKANQQQLAYSGYKDNIEAFLCATALQTKVITAAEHHIIPSTYVPTIPLAMPRTLFKLAKKPTPAQLEKLTTALQSEGINTVQLGKGESSYYLTRPSFGTLITKLPNFCFPRCGSIDGYSHVLASSRMGIIWKCIDLFCAVNTYSYKSSDYRAPSDHAKRGVTLLMENRSETSYYRDGYTKAKKPCTRDEAMAENVERRNVDQFESSDLTPDISCEARMNHSVYVAKPSPLPSSTSWGQANQVPSRSGLLFPYFEGMLNPDVKYVRDVIGRRFFRNLGDSVTDPRQAYVELRETLGIAVTTPQGIALGHVLCGIDLALETQTQAFFVFDRSEYRGFVLLGEEFKVQIHGKWYAPISERELRDELKGLESHAESLETLLDLLKLCKDAEGDSITVSDDSRTCSGLADALAKIDFEKTEDKVEVEEIQAVLARIHFTDTYMTPKPDNLIWAIEELTTREAEPFPVDVPFYIPLKDWDRVDEKVHKVLASFGPRSYSFRNSKGTVITIPAPGEADPMEETDPKGELTIKTLIVYEKALREAIKDWDALAETGEIKAEWAERAVGSRANLYRGEPKKKIWDALKAGRANLSIGGHKDKGKGKESTVPAKRKAENIPSGSLDDFF